MASASLFRSRCHAERAPPQRHVLRIAIWNLTVVVYCNLTHCVDCRSKRGFGPATLQGVRFSCEIDSASFRMEAIERQEVIVVMPAALSIELGTTRVRRLLCPVDH